MDPRVKPEGDGWWMVEIWELNAVSETPIIEISDFSKEARAVQFKFVSVGLISLFVSIFKIDKNSSFFGVAVKNLNERLIEFGFFGIASLLGILYLWRLWEERDVFFKIDEKIRLLSEYARSEVPTIKRSIGDITIFIADFEKKSREIFETLASYEENLAKHIESTSVRFSKLPRTPENPKDRDYHIDVRKMADDALIQMDNLQMGVYEGVKDFQKTLLKEKNNVVSGASQIDGLIHALSKNVGDFRGFKRLNVKHRVRMLIFDITLPLILFYLIISNFLAPNELDPISHFILHKML